MGQRSKAELLGLVERIVEMHDQEKLSYEEIERALRNEGYDISREAIRRSHKSQEKIAESYRAAMEESKSLCRLIQENPNTDLLEATNALMTNKIFEFVRQVDELNFEDSSEIAKAISSLSGAQVRISKYRLDFAKGYDRAKKDILDQVKKRLKDFPEIIEKMKELIEEAKADDEK